MFKNQKSQIKAIFFAPDIHYGPSGTLAGSDFPYMLEHYSTLKYKAPTFVMHCAVDMDHNPVSNSQFSRIKDAFENGIKNSKALRSLQITHSQQASTEIQMLSDWDLNDISIVTLTRAPRVTEDVSLDSATLFNELLESKFGTSLIIDAHNSRYEAAPKVELDGIKFNTKEAKEYIKAIKGLDGPEHKTKKMRMGFAGKEIYSRLENPIDIAKGNLNIAVFQFNDFRYAIIQFNANNALPTIRNEIIEHVRHKFGIQAELYTTDTHAVNSLEHNAQNVLGRYTKYPKLITLVDQTMAEAITISSL